MEPDADARARVSLVGPAPMETIVLDVFDRIRARGAEPLHMHRALAHAPHAFRAWVGVAHALRDWAATPRDLQELVILRVLHTVNGDYELAQHRLMALACGLTREQIEAVAHWRDTDVFNSTHRFLLTFAEELVSADGVSDATFAALQEHSASRRSSS